MKRKGIPALFLTLGLVLVYFAAYAGQAGAFQKYPVFSDPPPLPPDPSDGPEAVSASGGSTAMDEAGAESAAWTPLPVADDPLLRLPGTQPDQGVVLDGPGQCINCHADYDPLTEPYNNWQGSMMAQAARDFLYWATVTVAGQDSIWALGNPNATDFCLRCHMPGGWLGGRSDPTNGSAMTGIDFDGVQCNLCHYLYDPFYETTYAGTREGNDWPGYWDESNASATPSSSAALALYNQDSSLAAAVTKFNGTLFYTNDLSPAGFTENGSGQMFVSTLNDNRRASFADANANHAINYSRYHKSKYFCSTCHDISNPVLANLGADPTAILPTEANSSSSYYHVERTFSEFMLSDFGLQGGVAGIGPYDPAVFDTSQPGNKIATCQDCHMRDQAGKAADKNRAILRPDGSIEHPKSGVLQHDLTGGNMWVSYILASAVSGSANYDATNDALLNQGASVLTMDLTSGEAFDPPSLLAGVARSEQNLHDAAAIQGINYSMANGQLSFQVQNQTGHKLISGYPEGRRMFLNIRFYYDDDLLLEVNPYDSAAGTLKGLSGYVYDDPNGILPDPTALGANERYVDELVYEMHGSSSITGEDETFHFALSDGRYKDNRIPPMGFRIGEAGARLAEPVWQGNPALDYFSAAEYVGGYDEIDLGDFGVRVPGADKIEISLYYQTTSREYIEFLRNEINGEGELTLSSPGVSGDPAYLIQTDPFFSQLKAWGDTMWQLWSHNMNLPGAAPVPMVTSIYTPSVNSPPVAVGDHYTTTKNINLVVATPGVLENDSDSNSDPLTAEPDSSPNHGAVSLESDGSFVYTPTLDYFGSDVFTYHADDGLDGSNTVAVTITIRASNATPVAVSDKYTTTEDIPLVVAAPGVLDNDSDSDSDPLTAGLDSAPSHGALYLDSDGSFVYTPTLNFNGLDSFTYQANDGQLESNTVVVTLTITSANDPPIAINDRYTTTEDITLFVVEPGVLENDIDIEGHGLTATLGSPPSHGVLILESDGSFVYTPTLNFNGIDSFTYRANDGLANSNTAVVMLTVLVANDPPIAANDRYTTTRNTRLTILAPGVLGNDEDIDGDDLTAILDTEPLSGTLQLQSDGSFVYTPTTGFSGQDSFTYYAYDGVALSNLAAVTLIVTAVNDPPVAVGDHYTTTEDITLVVPVSGVLANDHDPEGNPLTAILNAWPDHGSLILALDGSFVYTPSLNYHGVDNFTYHANDGQLDSNTVVVTLTVEATNDPPIAVNDRYTITEDITQVVAKPGVLGNDFDVDSDPLTAVLGVNVAHGELTLRPDGSFVYTPTQNFSGIDSFTYQANDGLANSNTAVVTLTVSPANDPPIAIGDAYTTTEDVTLDVPAPGVLENDSDPDGDTLTAVLIGNVTHGDLVLNLDGSFVYTPTRGYAGLDNFTYRAHDGQAGSETVTGHLTVEAKPVYPVYLPFVLKH